MNYTLFLKIFVKRLVSKFQDIVCLEDLNLVICLLLYLFLKFIKIPMIPILLFKKYTQISLSKSSINGKKYMPWHLPLVHTNSNELLRVAYLKWFTCELTFTRIPPFFRAFPPSFSEICTYSCDYNIFANAYNLCVPTFYAIVTFHKLSGNSQMQSSPTFCQ